MNNIVSSDPIADMLSRMRNAIAVGKFELTVPYSKLKHSVADVLQQNGYIDHVAVTGDLTDKTLVISLRTSGQSATITEIVRLSKPGRRQYVRSQEIPVIKRGRGIVIVSTSKGMMTGDEAKAKKIGGELVCQVY